MQNSIRRTWTGVAAGAAVLVAAVVVVVLLFPSWLRDTSPVESRQLASWADASNREEDAATSRPGWAPDDATDIELRYRVRNVPGWDVAMTSAQGLDTDACTRIDTDGLSIALPADFMPEVFPREAWTCGDGRVVWQDGDRVYGATPDRPVAR